MPYKTPPYKRGIVFIKTAVGLAMPRIFSVHEVLGRIYILIKSNDKRNSVNLFLKGLKYLINHFLNSIWRSPKNNVISAVILPQNYYSEK